jgi:hypothetical protein
MVNNIDDLKKIIKDINVLIYNLTHNKIKKDRYKERKHRPLNKNNDVDNIIEPTNIYFNDLHNINMGIISDRKIKDKNFTNEKRIKINNKNIYKYTKEIKIDINKQLGISLYPIILDEEINRIIKGYKKEREEYKLLFKNMIKKENININLKNLSSIILENKDIHNRIFIINDRNEIIKYFGKNIDYKFVIFFTPPEKDISMYSLYYYNNNCQMANSYIFVKNSKDEYHLFYGYIDKIDKKYEVKNENEIINHLFIKHVIQNNKKFCLINSYSIEFYDDYNNIYKENFSYNNNLCINFCKLLKLHLSTIIPPEKIDINPLDDSFYLNVMINNNLKIDKIGIKIKLIMDNFKCYINDKLIILNNKIKINYFINNNYNINFELEYDKINKKYILCIIILEKYDNFLIKNEILKLYNLKSLKFIS